MMSPKAMAQDIAEELERDMGISQCWNVPVNHCRDAYAFVMHSSQGWKLVYSGDTRPCDQLVDAGAGATILIHEATFDDSMELEARSKRHRCASRAA
jgi:ribonuclease Z